MRTLDQCFHRGSSFGFQEEGRGLGFSIGGWHPFRANTYLPTLKKLDPLANTAIGKAVWKPIEKVNQTVNKDFSKAKKWSQEHRKQLQIAAALAAAAVGGYFAYGALTAESAGAAAVGAGAGEGTIATAAMTSEALAPIAATSAETLSLVPATVGATEGTIATAAMTSETLAPLVPSATSGLSLVPATAPAVTASSFAPLTATASSGSGILGTVGSAAQSFGPLLALSKLIKGAPQQDPGQQIGTDAYGPIYMGGSGGGGSLGPMVPMGPEAPASASQALPAWFVPAGIAALLVYFIKE